MIVEKILTIAIPTYNRALTLQDGLKKLLPQISDHKNEIELLISDNCSTDDTQQVVKSFIDKGYPISYNRNEKNLGMDGNFSYCFKNASGKYVWILGDDDHLIDDALSYILELIKNNDFGLIHLDVHNYANSKYVTVYTSVSTFLEKISFYITFLSSNIVKREVVSNINLEKYKGTLFTQVPVYLEGALNNSKNAIVSCQIMEIATAAETNGGYNIFEVFVANLLNIFSEYRSRIGWYWYEVEKYKLLRGFVYPWMLRLLINSNHGSRFKTDNWFSVIIKKYWYLPYFYLMLLVFSLKKILYAKENN